MAAVRAFVSDYVIRLHNEVLVIQFQQGQIKSTFSVIRVFDTRAVYLSGVSLRAVCVSEAFETILAYVV